ncbi:MAG TPA: dihydrofolate reductase family protein [Verrucomicrobiae bacterium]|nr:dihydrofolate reductase family protein [Verrucomicrobiae bacterium]
MAPKKAKRRAARGALPFVFLNVAATADGKLAPASRHFIPFSGKRDQEHLLELRATADAVMSGARTVDLNPVKLGSGGAKYRRQRLKRGLTENNLRIIVSGSGTINPRAEIFKHRFSPIIILTTGRAGKVRLDRLRALADEVKICGDKELDFNYALRWLRERWRVKRLLCEGGGEVNGALFQAGLVNEVHLTLAPVIFGGRNAPTMADGEGVEKLADATRLKIKSLKRVGNELFLVYRVVT